VSPFTGYPLRFFVNVEFLPRPEHNKNLEKIQRIMPPTWDFLARRTRRFRLRYGREGAAFKTPASVKDDNAVLSDQALKLAAALKEA